MSDNSVTIIGNLTNDPEMRFTPSGHPVVNFNVAVNRRYKDDDGNWQDKLDGFFGCTVWRELAEHVAESLVKGSRVIVTGRLSQNSWEDDQGNKRSKTQIQVDEIGPSLRWATTEVHKVTRQTAADDGGSQEGSWS